MILSHTGATLNENQGHSHWCQNVKFSGVGHHTKFETNPSVNVRTQVSLFFSSGFFFVFGLFVKKKINNVRFPSFDFNTDQMRYDEYEVYPTNKSLQYTKFHSHPHFEHCEIISTNAFAFLHACDLEGQGQLDYN